jgi:nucleotide-binding universal stress UspA family protein
MKTVIQLLLSFVLFVPNLWAADQLITLPLARTGVSTSYWWMPRDGAQTTVLLISGGAGGMGFDGTQPKSDNFLVRTRELFAAKGFNVAVLGLSSDMRDLTQEIRVTTEHAQDVLAVVKAIRAASPRPVWLVGTSRGTFSAAAAAMLDQGQAVDGIVLTSGYHPGLLKLRTGPLSQLGVDSIKVPTLVYHHKNDGCRETLASGVTGMVTALSSSPVKKLWLVEGGGPPSGNPCQPRGFHGFVGMEQQAIDDIASWINKPQM